MEEYKEAERSDEAICAPTTFKAKLDNFWYHYKWHTIVALFVITVVTICTVQMLSVPKYDVYVMYAGGETISRQSKDGDIPRYNQMVGGFEKFANDYDGKNGATVSFSDLFIPSPEEKEELGANADYSSMRQDIQTLNDRMSYSEYYVFLVSKYVYDQYHVRSETEMFAPIKQYCPEDNNFVFEGENAIYLASTDLYKLAPFSDLPEDTLICIRIKSAFSSAFGKEKTNEYYRRAEEYLKTILAYKHPAA